MNREFFLILASVFLFVAVNTLFYFQILGKQLDFQTDLLSRQTQICSNTVEQVGQQFENELRSIPYDYDFTRLFVDEEIKQQGSVSLQKLYTGYSDLINKITVYDRHNNVYSLILDTENNFVSDYYESQRQAPLSDRDQLNFTGEKYLLTIPGFDAEGMVQSNIVVDLNYTRFVNAIFKRYSLEQALWQWLVSNEGELVSTAESNLQISEGDLRRIGTEVVRYNEGSIEHSIIADSTETRVVSAYYPVQLVNRDFGIVFSIKTDLFLQSIVKKLIIVTLCSLLLLAVLLYIHYRSTRGKPTNFRSQKLSENTLTKTIDLLPFGLVYLNPDGGIGLMNDTSKRILGIDEKEEPKLYGDLGLENIHLSANGSLYHRIFGEGSLLWYQHGAKLVHIYKMEWEADLGGNESRIIFLIDVSEIESYRTLNKTTEQARLKMLENMAKEISQPISQVRKSITSTKDPELDKAFTLLSNLINATLDFSRHEAKSVVVEEIPFYIRSEIDLALEGFRDSNSSVSIITKVRNEVPEKLIGDPFRLRQAISSLVANSAGTTDEGRILVSCELLEQHGGLLQLQINIEDTGSGMSAEETDSIMKDLHRGRINATSERDKFRQRIAAAQEHVRLQKGQLWIESPSSISTSPDHPGMKYSFTIDVFPAESIRENLVFEETSELSEINCLILSQEKETETDRFKTMLSMGIKPKFLVYREENLESVYELVAEKAPSLQMLVIVNTESQDGFGLAGSIISKGLHENFILILLSSVHKSDYHSIARGTGIDYYIEEPCEPHRLSFILEKHFPGIKKDDFAKSAGSEQVREGTSILLAEDNLFNRKVIQGLFKRMGLEISLAENGAQAVEMVKSSNYDFVFMDLVMPELDGLQAAAEIRKLGFKFPIIALTAVESQDTRDAAIKAGFNDYLIKPASEEKLREILSAGGNG